MTDQETVRSLSNTFEHYIPLTSRAALPYSALYYELPVEERGASLADVASIVGMRLAVDSAKSTGRGGTGAAADDGVGSERPVSSMECKIERRQTGELLGLGFWSPSNKPLTISSPSTAARNRPSNKSIAQEARNRRQLVDAMNNFGGFSGHIQVSHSR